jgi:hypothetical protein
MYRSQDVLALAWLVSLALVACAGDAGTKNAEKDAAVADADSGGDPGAGAGGGAAVSGGGGAANGGGGAGGAYSGEPSGSLFTDPQVPKCEKDGGKIVGRIAGEEVEFNVGFSSTIGAGHFAFLSARGNEIVNPLVLSFLPRNLAKGVTSKLIGGTFWVPEGQPGGGRDYCITQGVFGPLPADEQPTAPDTAAFKFRIDAAYAEADCSGGPVEVDLRGCIYRNNGLIPANGAEPTPGADAAECSPLSRRLQGGVLDDALTSCQDGAALTGMPNPQHFGSNNALALHEPLVPGKRYAMNLSPSKGSASSPMVGEIWGQSAPCGPVDELLWVGAIGAGNRICTEFQPAREHSNLLLVTRAQGFDANGSLGALRICDDGSCAGKTEGQGARPGLVLKTVAGAYDYNLRAVLNDAWMFRVGTGGELLAMEGEFNTFEDRPLAAVAFRMAAGEPWSDRWYCANAGRLTEGESRLNYTVKTEGITQMPACGNNPGSNAVTIQWDKMSGRGTVTASSLPAFPGDVYARGDCSLSACDINIASDTTALHIFAHVDGDLGPEGMATTTFTAPVAEASLFISTRADPSLSFACGLTGTVMRGPTTVEMQLTGLGTLAACSGTPATPSSETFALKGW